MKFSPPSGTVAPGAHFWAPHFLPCLDHGRPGPHSVCTSDTPLFSPPGLAPPLAPPFFSSPLLGKETGAPPHGLLSLQISENENNYKSISPFMCMINSQYLECIFLMSFLKRSPSDTFN
jgi:hypothetical protein